MSSFVKAAMHDEKYLSHFEDYYGNVTHKELNRPETCHFLHECLLTNDEDKKRQSMLGLERKGSTRYRWVRLSTSVVGFSVVTIRMWCRPVKLNADKNE